MTEHERPNLLSSSIVDLLHESVRNEPGPDRTSWHRMRRVTRCLRYRICTFRSDDYRKILAGLITTQDLCTHLVDVVRNFRDENHIGRCGNTSVKRNEPGMTAHYLHHDHSVMTLCCRMQLVDRLDRSVYCGVETERRNRAAHVVVDRLRHSDDPEPAPYQLQRDAESPVSADRH